MTDPQTLPKSHLNKGFGTVVHLRCTCPLNCVCGGKTLRDWVHLDCSDPNFINDQGFIFCKNYPNRCTEYFIQDASFKCEKSNSWEKYNELYEFLTALSQAMQAPTFSLKDQAKNNFIKNIMLNVGNRWTF